MRRGIDIDAGCGQLKSKVEKTMSPEKQELLQFAAAAPQKTGPFVVDETAVDLDDEFDFDDPEYTSDVDKKEVERLINLVKGTTIRVPADSEKEKEQSQVSP